MMELIPRSIEGRTDVAVRPDSLLFLVFPALPSTSEVQTAHTAMAAAILDFAFSWRHWALLYFSPFVFGFGFGFLVLFC